MPFTFPWLLFHPNIPKPLHGLAPRVVLGDKWWNKTKNEAKEKNDQHCWTCGVHKYDAKYHQWLEAHECYSINYGLGRVEYVGTCALCHACHNYIHDGRMQMMVDAGKLFILRYRNILDHGESILEKWFENKGWKWNGYKKLNEPMRPYFEIYPDLPKLSEKITWEQGEGDAKWEDYHMIIEGVRYERSHKTFDAWLEFHKTFK